MATVHIDLTASSILLALCALYISRGTADDGPRQEREASPHLGVGNETTKELTGMECYPVFQTLGKAKYRFFITKSSPKQFQ